MTTTILGANGKLGGILTSFARNAGLDWQTQSRTGAADVRWSGQYDDPAADQIFRPGATLINMIGCSGPNEAHLHAVNVRFVETLLAKAHQTGAAHVVLASSAAVYGGAGTDPITEEALLRPLTPYGASKVAMEQMVSAFANLNDGPAITIARIGNVAGADALTAAAKRHIASKTAMPLHRFDDNAAPVRSYIGPRDLFDVMHGLSVLDDGSDTSHPRIVNVAHPHPISLDQVLHAYRAYVFRDLEWADAPAPIGVPRSVILCTKKLQTIVALRQDRDPAMTLGRQMAEYLGL